MDGERFPLIEVSGTAYEMGYQHGVQASEPIHRYVAWLSEVAGLSREALSRKAMVFLPLMEAMSPSFVTEVRGVADGAGIPLEEAVLCQCRFDAQKAPTEGCTAFAVRGSATASGEPLAGQNQDLRAEFADLGILLRVRPNDGRPRALMFTFAGQIGFRGVNEFGVAHFFNAIKDYQWQMGLPHWAVERVLLEQRTVEDCAEVLARHRLCAAGNYVFCDGQGEIGDVEVVPGATAPFRDDREDWVVHANHYQTEPFVAHQVSPAIGSRARLERMRTLIREKWGHVTVETMKAALADHDSAPQQICQHGEGGSHSIAGYIAEPARGLFHVRRGYGCTGTWQTYHV